jgi:hypothetical protein
MKFISYKYWLNEKFTDESDPIHDLGIGVIRKINIWIDEKLNLSPTRYFTTLIREYDFKNNTCKQDKLDRSKIKINNDLSIDIEGWIDLSDSDEILPEYIHLGHIYGDLACSFSVTQYEKFMPKQVDGEIRYYMREHTETDEQIKEKIKKVCKVKLIDIRDKN